MMQNIYATRDCIERGMYSSVIIEGFRLFDHLELDDLARVNLFFGPNNSGKTSILEAIFTHACGLNFESFRGHIVPRRQSGSFTGPLEAGVMKRIILCEGKTDAILISYFLERKFGWSYSRKNVIGLPVDQNNEVLNWYSQCPMGRDRIGVGCLQTAGEIIMNL